MKRLLVNDMLSALPDHRTFWHLLKDWFDCEFVGGDYDTLPTQAKEAASYFDLGLSEWIQASVLIRNASYFGPIETPVPQIALLQDIMPDGPQRAMQQAVIATCKAVVFNSAFTKSQYGEMGQVIPLPVDFETFRPGNAMGLQQALGLPAGCTVWVGASQGAAGQVKGWDIFQMIVRLNPDLSFVAVFKDAIPDIIPPNLRAYARVTHEELARIIGASAVGLCTSRIESQHLAGIEMGACGLPLVVPPVGTYWQRENMPGIIESDLNVPAYSAAIRKMREQTFDRDLVRDSWRREFHPEVVRLQWTDLVARVEKA